MAESEHEETLGKEIVEGLAELNAAIEANEGLRGRFRVTEVHGYHDVSDLYEDPKPMTDKRRLDWLGTRRTKIGWICRFSKGLGGWELFETDAIMADPLADIRDAIDAAMEREKGGG
jgi:hypothetical protein